MAATSLPRRSSTETPALRVVRWWRELGWRHVVGLAVLVFALFPVVWIVSASFNPAGTLTSQQLIPQNADLSNYRQLMDQFPFWSWFWNSMQVAGVTAILTTLLAASAAYSFSRMRFTGRRTGLLGVLLVQMFPQILAFTAIFLMMTNIKSVFPAVGLGTKPGLMLVYLGGAMGVNTWLIKGFFDTIPTSLDEAARVDGASHNQIFFRIILPLATPVLAVVALLSFVLLLNDFVLASAVLGQGSPENFTLAVGLYNMVNEQFSSRWGMFAAGALIAGIPVVLLFQFLQRFIVSGLTAGGVKG